MLRCQQVEQQADALIDGTPLSRRERVALRVHLLICRHCRRYLRQFQALLIHLRAPDETLSDTQTQALIERIDREPSVYAKQPPN